MSDVIYASSYPHENNASGSDYWTQPCVQYHDGVGYQSSGGDGAGAEMVPASTSNSNWARDSHLHPDNPAIIASHPHSYSQSHSYLTSYSHFSPAQSQSTPLSQAANSWPAPCTRRDSEDTSMHARPDNGCDDGTSGLQDVIALTAKYSENVYGYTENADPQLHHAGAHFLTHHDGGYYTQPQPQPQPQPQSHHPLLSTNLQFGAPYESSISSISSVSPHSEESQPLSSSLVFGQQQGRCTDLSIMGMPMDWECMDAVQKSGGFTRCEMASTVHPQQNNQSSKSLPSSYSLSRQQQLYSSSVASSAPPASLSAESATDISSYFASVPAQLKAGPLITRLAHSSQPLLSPTSFQSTPTSQIQSQSHLAHVQTQAHIPGLRSHAPHFSAPMQSHSHSAPVQMPQNRERGFSLALTATSSSSELSRALDESASEGREISALSAPYRTAPLTVPPSPSTSMYRLKTSDSNPSPELTVQRKAKAKVTGQKRGPTPIMDFLKPPVYPFDDDQSEGSDDGIAKDGGVDDEGGEECGQDVTVGNGRGKNPESHVQAQRSREGSRNSGASSLRLLGPSPIMTSITPSPALSSSISIPSTTTSASASSRTHNQNPYPIHVADPSTNTPMQMLAHVDPPLHFLVSSLGQAFQLPQHQATAAVPCPPPCLPAAGLELTSGSASPRMESAISTSTSVSRVQTPAVASTGVASSIPSRPIPSPVPLPAFSPALPAGFIQAPVAVAPLSPPATTPVPLPTFPVVSRPVPTPTSIFTSGPTLTSSLTSPSSTAAPKSRALPTASTSTPTSGMLFMKDVTALIPTNSRFLQASQGKRDREREKRPRKGPEPLIGPFSVVPQQTARAGRRGRLRLAMCVGALGVMGKGRGTNWKNEPWTMPSSASPTAFSSSHIQAPTVTGTSHLSLCSTEPAFVSGSSSTHGSTSRSHTHPIIPPPPPPPPPYRTGSSSCKTRVARLKPPKPAVVAAAATFQPPTRRVRRSLACLFCKKRKIACEPLWQGSRDMTCNQCARRSLKCEYLSHRGKHDPKGYPRSTETPVAATPADNMSVMTMTATSNGGTGAGTETGAEGSLTALSMNDVEAGIGEEVIGTDEGQRDKHSSSSGGGE